MAEDRLQRRLSALISADVADYSRLMADDQIGTIRSLKACRERMQAAVDEFGGRVSDFVGDNMLAEFPNARDAVDCAAAIHGAVGELNRNLAGHRQIKFRIGIHLGDVMFDGRQLFGESVNIFNYAGRSAERYVIAREVLVHIRKLEFGIGDARIDGVLVGGFQSLISFYLDKLSMNLPSKAPGSPAAKSTSILHGILR